MASIRLLVRLEMRRPSRDAGVASRLLTPVVSTWRAAQKAQWASGPRTLISLSVASLLFVIAGVVYFIAGQIVFHAFVAVGIVGQVIGWAAVHHQDEARGRS